MWTKTSEKELPDGVPVLGWWPHDPHACIVKRIGTVYWDPQAGDDYLFPPLHWMPLPEPPEGE